MKPGLGGAQVLRADPREVQAIGSGRHLEAQDVRVEVRGRRDVVRDEDDLIERLDANGMHGPPGTIADGVMGRSRALTSRPICYHATTKQPAGRQLAGPERARRPMIARRIGAGIPVARVQRPGRDLDGREVAHASALLPGELRQGMGRVRRDDVRHLLPELFKIMPFIPGDPERVGRGGRAGRRPPTRDRPPDHPAPDPPGSDHHDALVVLLDVGGLSHPRWST